jgi:glycosyltransferase involved in cell wall biosynthesis
VSTAPRSSHSISGDDAASGTPDGTRDRRRYGLLGGWSSRLPRTEDSSLDIVLWNVARALKRRGADVVVGCAALLDAPSEGVELFAAPSGRDWLLRMAVDRLTRGRMQVRWSSRLHHPTYVLGGVDELRRRGADAIVVTHEYANLQLARLLGRGVPLITHLHAVWVDDHPELARRLLCADGVAVVSEFVRAAVLSAEPRLAERTFTVRNGVDLDAFPGRAAVRASDGAAVTRWRQRLEAEGRPLIVAVVGQVAPEKGLHTLAEAAAILRTRGIDAVVAVAGNVGHGYARPGRARSATWRRVESLRENYVGRLHEAARGAPFTILGKLRPDDLRVLLAAADVFASPSLTPEPCPLPVLEALAMDLPVVASDDGGYPELVGDAGVLLPPDQPGALADVLQELLLGAAARARYAERARAQAARHSWDASAAALASMVAAVA